VRKIDTDALSAVAPALGVGAPGTATEDVDFDDGVLQQVLEVAPLVRRGRTIGLSTGIWTGAFVHVHAAGGASVIGQTIDPYDPNLAQVTLSNGWPNPVPAAFDVWLMAVTCETGASGANFTSALFQISYEAAAMAMRRSAGGTINVEEVIAAWDAFQQIGAEFVGQMIDPPPNVPQLPRRIRRGDSLVGVSSVANNMTVTLGFVLGLFPAGLGQDAI
jgi:hypothetical protein